MRTVLLSTEMVNINLNQAMKTILSSRSPGLEPGPMPSGQARDFPPKLNGKKQLQEV